MARKMRDSGVAVGKNFHAEAQRGRGAEKMKPSGIPWIGEIPEGWEVRRLRYIATSFRKGAGITKADVIKDGDIACIRYGEIYSKYKNDVVVMECLSRTNKNLISTPQRIIKGDVLFSCTGELVDEIGKNIAYMGDEECLAGGDIIVMGHNQNPVFLSYVLNSYAQTQKSHDKTKLKVVHISTGDIKNLLIAIPPIAEQKAIADYLDEKCAAIDGAVGELKRGIEDCKAWKKAIIEETVFSGLRHKEFVETGDDWLTSIPSSWGFEQIRYLFALRDERNDKPLSEVNLISLYTDQGVVQHCDLEKTTGNKASTADGYKIIKENDIVVNIILCWMGAIGRSAYNGVTSPAYDVYRPVDESRVLSRYYHYLFRTSRFNGKCYQEGRGIMMMRWRTYSSEFRAIKVPVPPMKEQQAIANYLDEKCAAIDALVAEKEKLIADLEAYKKSLIFELVTGKREVA